MLLKIVAFAIPFLTQELVCMTPQTRTWASVQAPDVEAYARTPHLTKRRGARSLWLAKRNELRLLGLSGVCAARTALHSLTVRYDGTASSARAIIRLQIFLADENRRVWKIW